MTRRTIDPATVTRARGATIVEILVVIGIVGVLFSMGFPALMRARAAAGQTASLANARSAALAVDSWRADHADTYPVIQTGVAYPVHPGSSGGITITSDEARWHTRHHWWAVLADTVDLAAHWGSWFSPGADPTRDDTPSYRFSNSFVAAPRLWATDFNDDAAVLRPVQGAEVVHPSHKVMMWDGVLAYVHQSVVPDDGPTRLPVPMVFADLHGEARRLVDAADPITNPLNSSAWASAKLHNTPNGVAGADYGVQNP